VNVAAQQRDPASLFNWMARMIRVRKECPEIGWGDWAILATGAQDVLALRYDWRGNSVIVVHNFAAEPRAVRIRAGVEDGERLVDLLAEEESRASSSGVHRIALDAFGYRWFRVGGLNYALRRTRQ
jgi:maltose alpha-D-glucosyltransferase/alpha-amylase